MALTLQRFDRGRLASMPTSKNSNRKFQSMQKYSAKVWAIANTTVTLLLIVWNYLGGTGVLSSVSVADVSDRYRTVFTPADYAFSIWGVIFLAQLVFCGHQIKRAFGDARLDPSKDDYVVTIGPRYLLAQLACGAWLVAWLGEELWLSLVLMCVLGGALLSLIFRLNLERDDPPWGVISCVWWPISIYAGWISVAFLANLSSLLFSLGGNFTQSVAWGAGLAVALVSFHLYFIFRRNMREFSLVAVWALVAIAARHLSGEHTLPGFAGLAIGLSVVVLLAAGYQGYKSYTGPEGDHLRAT